MMGQENRRIDGARSGTVRTWQTPLQSPVSTLTTTSSLAAGNIIRSFVAQAPAWPSWLSAVARSTRLEHSCAPDRGVDRPSRHAGTVKELFADLDRWRAAGTRVAIARVVDLEGSGPRLPGAAMAVTEHGDVRGSVSGGCVEGAVVVEALDVLDTGDRRMVTFGYSDDEAFAVGLTCGGTIHLFVEPLDW